MVDQPQVISTSTVFISLPVVIWIYPYYNTHIITGRPSNLTRKTMNSNLKETLGQSKSNLLQIYVYNMLTKELGQVTRRGIRIITKINYNFIISNPGNMLSKLQQKFSSETLIKVWCLRIGERPPQTTQHIDGRRGNGWGQQLLRGAAADLQLQIHQGDTGVREDAQTITEDRRS